MPTNTYPVGVLFPTGGKKTSKEKNDPRIPVTEHRDLSGIDGGVSMVSTLEETGM